MLGLDYYGPTNVDWMADHRDNLERIFLNARARLQKLVREVETYENAVSDAWPISLGI